MCNQNNPYVDTFVCSVENWNVNCAWTSFTLDWRMYAVEKVFETESVSVHMWMHSGIGQTISLCSLQIEPSNQSGPTTAVMIASLLPMVQGSVNCRFLLLNTNLYANVKPVSYLDPISFITMPADSLAPYDARTYTGTVLTINFGMCCLSFSAFQWFRTCVPCPKLEKD